VRISIARPLVALFAISALAATASAQQKGSSSTASGTVDLSAYPIPPLDASEQQLLRGMSDADILGHFITVDSMEVATADSAIRILKTDDVLAYARLMHAAHTEHWKHDRDVASQAGITPITIFGGLKASHVAASLDSVHAASDVTLDRHYVMSQVELHQHVLAELEELQKVAKNPAVRDEISATIPVVRDHLARAHALAVEKGFEKKRA
jgi:predicted outer membrane protein